MKKLTIGMIIKNESENLERCLSAIKPVLDNVSSELVIVDTGSTDSSVEIAKKYTDRVYDYVWTNNFAAARNESLKYATGEWFMIVDADEFLADASEIIAFFNTGEYKNYDAASYVQRNFSIPDSKVAYSDTFTLRMFKRTDGRKFVGSIHESVETNGIRQIKMLSQSVFKHWGYCIEVNREKYMAKILNYEKLIMGEIESEPSNTIRYIQLSDVYTVYATLKAETEKLYFMKSIKSLEKGIEVERAKQNCNRMFVCACYKAVSKIYRLMGDYKMLGETCKEYFVFKMKYGVGNIGSDLDMYVYRAIACFELKDFNTATEFFAKYIRFYKEVDAGKHSTYELMTVSNVTHYEIFFYFAVQKLIEAFARCGQISEMDKYIDEYLCDEHSENPTYVFERIDVELVTVNILNDESRIVGIIKRYSERGKEISDYIIGKVEERFRNSKNKEELLKILSDCDALPEMYKNLVKLRYAEITGSEIDWSCLEFFFTNDGYIEPAYGDVLYFAVKYGVNFDDIATIFDLNITEVYVDNFTVESKSSEQAFYSRINEDMGESDVSACLIYAELCKIFMLKNETDEKNRIDFFGRFAAISFEYLSLILNMENLNENSAYVLPVSLREKYLSGFAFVELSDGNYKRATDYIDMIVKFSPKYGILGQRIYAMSVKASICDLVAKNELELAKKLAKQYENTYGEDDEITALISN